MFWHNLENKTVYLGRQDICYETSCILFTDPRPEEVSNSMVEHTFSETEGTDNTFEKQYILPLATAFELKRTFTQPGVELELMLTSSNMHDEDDNAVMFW